MSLSISGRILSLYLDKSALRRADRICGIYCGSRDYEAREVGYIINKLFQNGNPVWKDTYVYAITEDEYKNRKMPVAADGIL